MDVKNNIELLKVEEEDLLPDDSDQLEQKDLLEEEPRLPEQKGDFLYLRLFFTCVSNLSIMQFIQRNFVFTLRTHLF